MGTCLSSVRAEHLVRKRRAWVRIGRSRWNFPGAQRRKKRSKHQPHEKIKRPSTAELPIFPRNGHTDIKQWHWTPRPRMLKGAFQVTQIKVCLQSTAELVSSVILNNLLSFCNPVFPVSAQHHAKAQCPLKELGRMTITLQAVRMGHARMKVCGSYR